jgi:hypothetical protein
MTEKINGNAPKWFWGIYLAALPVMMGLVIAMLAFYLNQLTVVVDGCSNEIITIKTNQRNISRILYLNPETSPDNKDELRLIFHNTRTMQ